MTRIAACLALALACLAVFPVSPARAQGSDTLWVEDFSPQPSRTWTTQEGSWLIRGTEYRGQCSTYRRSFTWAASVVSHATAGTSWQTIATVRGTTYFPGHETPAIIALRQNVTNDKKGYGLEIVFSSSGADVIRLVRYETNYANVTPSIAQIDTNLVDDASYSMWFSVLHTGTAVELKGKIWPAEEAAPEGWLLEANSDLATEVSGGDVGIGAVGTTNYPIVAVDRVIALGDKEAVEPQTWGRIKQTFR